MADQKIVPFLFEGEHTVRTLERDEHPWFVAKDICSILGITWKGSDSTGPLGTMEADEKATCLVQTPGGVQEMVVVSESGLYALIFKSRKPEAIRFRKWVTNEVLPTIRRTGSYSPQGSVEVMRRKPFEEWTVEEVNAYRGLVTEARHTLNVAAAAWMMERLGFPMPPRHLLPAWQQGIEGF